MLVLSVDASDIFNPSPQPSRLRLYIELPIKIFRGREMFSGNILVSLQNFVFTVIVLFTEMCNIRTICLLDCIYRYVFWICALS